MTQAGDVLAGKYQLDSQIGEGGMATVWRALQLPLNRPVAIKFLHGVEGPRSAEIMQRFLSEAQALAAVRHPNIVDIIDFGTSAENQPYMVMELLEGMSLSSRLEGGKPMPLDELERIILPVMSGIAAVHAAGIVHRDIKPENIYLSRGLQGLNPKLLDFGVSRSVGKWYTGLSSAIPTVHGLIVGTPHYMSPEQARGVADIDHRTDIYSVGVIVYQALSGKLPFDAEHIGDLIVMVTSGKAPPFSSLRPDLGPQMSTFIDRSMAKDRDLRFHDMQAMTQAFQAALSHARSPSWVLGGYDQAQPGKKSSERQALHHSTSSDRPTQLSSDFPDAAISRMRRRRRVRNSLVWFAVIAVLGAVLVGVAKVRDQVNKQNRTSQPKVAPPPLPSSRTVTVRLIGVPSAANVWVDGTLSPSSTVVLPESEREYKIEVTAPGFVPWRATHRADNDGRYEVLLESESTKETVEDERQADDVKQVSPESKDEKKETGERVVKEERPAKQAKVSKAEGAKDDRRDRVQQHRRSAPEPADKSAAAESKPARTTEPQPEKTTKPSEKRSLFEALRR